MRASQWDSQWPATVNLNKVLGLPVEAPLDTGPTPDLGELVDRTLAAIEQLLNGSGPVR